MTSECAWKRVYICTQICASNVMRVSFPDCMLEFVLILSLRIYELFKLFDRSIVKHFVEILLSRPNDQNMSIKMKIIHVHTKHLACINIQWLRVVHL